MSETQLASCLLLLLLHSTWHVYASPVFQLVAEQAVAGSAPKSRCKDACCQHGDIHLSPACMFHVLDGHRWHKRHTPAKMEALITCIAQSHLQNPYSIYTDMDTSASLPTKPAV